MMMTMSRKRRRRRLRGSANPRVALDRSMDAALAELEAKVAALAEIQRHLIALNASAIALADGYAEGDTSK